MQPTTTIVGTEAAFDESRFSAFPNPVSDWLNLQTDIAEIETMQIHDVSGRVVLQSTFQPSIDVHQLNSGMYIVSLFNDQNQFSLLQNQQNLTPMKNYLNTFFFMVCAFAAIAQTPQKVQLSGGCRNAQGAILPNQNVKIRASILDGSANGDDQYTDSVITSQLGLFNLAIGGGILVSGDFMTISWANGDKFLEIEMDATNGWNFSLFGTSNQLVVCRMP